MIFRYQDLTPKLAMLTERIYSSKGNVPIQILVEFIEEVILLTDAGKIPKPDAGYIIVDVLLKYDENDVFDSVFGIAGDLEIESDSESDNSVNLWQELKRTFEYNK